jgi:pimeloyl-ACP methyl ester carboxylesterase
MTASLLPPRSRHLDLAGYEIHLAEWGEPGRPPLVMWHGLARTGRDFDRCAAHFAGRYHVICPDTIGRGLSSWAPAADYRFDVYARIAAALLEYYGFTQVRWLGTSMGGALGIHLAGGALAGRITHLAINDIGTELAASAVERILTYVGTPPAFAGVRGLEAYLRKVYAPYGRLADEEWLAMAETSARRLPDGRITLHYDPGIVQQFVHSRGDYELAEAYDRVVARTLLLRGANSDLLSPDVAAAMTRRGPRCRLETVPDCGHAPALNVPAQLSILEEFFAE